MSIEHGVGPQPAFAASRSGAAGAGHGAARQSSAAVGGFAMLLSSLEVDQDMELDTAAGLLAGGEDSDLQDALGATDLTSGLVQDDTPLQADDDEAAAASVAAMLNAQIPAQEPSSEGLALPQAVWATMQQAVAPAGGQQEAGSTVPGAGIGQSAGDAKAAKSAQAGARQAVQAGQNGQAGQAAKAAQAQQAEANPAASTTPAGQGVRSKASVAAERAAQQMTNVAAAAAQSQATGTQAAAPAGAQRPAVSWTQRAAAAQQRAEATKSSAARGSEANARAGMQAARDAAGKSSVQEWATWADASQTRFERGGEFSQGAGSTGAPDLTLGGVSVAASATSDSSVGGIRPQSQMPAEGGASPEMEVAEQVTYWVGRGVRNASISVQGLTENPIRIRIEMEGQEASIQFLAEQEQTRQVLSEATPHLRELLEREGLTLGEVSVGNSAHQPGGAGEREASSGGAGRGARDGKTAEPEEVIVARPAPRSSGLPSGRSVDLFV